MSTALAYEKVQVPKADSNVFDLSHDVKMSGNFGTLMPCMVMECIPGDYVKIGCENMVRFAPMLAPIMHMVHVRQEYFFVPWRIVWENWEKFISQDETQPAAPFITVNPALDPEAIKFLDYMGVPPMSSTGGVQDIDINALPLAAYQMIYNEYYRDQNLVNEVDFKLVDGDNNTNVNELTRLRIRAWEHDQFTSALPFAQKGSPVDLPLGEISLSASWNTLGTPEFVDTAGNAQTGAMSQVIGGIQVGTGPTNFPSAYDPNGTLQVEATTINDFRTALRIQEWLEINARGGTRYIEFIEAHFGVRGDDYRLQRPEYIVGTKNPVVISEVLNTTGPDADQPQGTMSGHGISVADGNLGKYYAKEYGCIIGIISIMPKTAYMQGMPKLYLKNDPFQYAFPKFANLGEESMTLDEVYAYQVSGKSTFGYLPRYYDYKSMPARIAGDFRDTLDFWHLARKFATPPTLSKEFIECQADQQDLYRIFAVEDPTSDHLWMHVMNYIKVRRKLPIYGIPSI